MTTVHTIPMEDVIEHVPYDDCLCGPTTAMTDDEDGDLVFVEVHHSLDGREYRESSPKYEMVEGDLMAFNPFKKGNTPGTKKKKSKNKKGVPASLLKSKSPKTPSKRKGGKRKKGK